jgi:tetratricopeptide (TPR) repeat protein
MKKWKQAAQLERTRISMKFSNNYIFFKDTKALEHALEHYQEIAPGNSATSASEEQTDSSPTTTPYSYNHIQDLEYQKATTATLESMKQAFANALLEPDDKQPSTSKANILESLASVLAALSQHQEDTGLLQQSIDALTNALEERDQKEAPEAWANTQNNLANTLLALAQQENRTKWFKAAEEAYLNALSIWTRDQYPKQWASTMHSLGITFHLQGKLLKGNRVFQKSVVAYKNALSKLDIEDDPVDRSMANNNRGAVLQHMAEREENAERMEEAIRAYEQSLLIWDEQLLPKHIATMVMANRSTARTTLAELTNDGAIAQQAADELILVTEIFSEACDAKCLKHCREQLKKAQQLVETATDNA